VAFLSHRVCFRKLLELKAKSSSSAGSRSTYFLIDQTELGKGAECEIFHDGVPARIKAKWEIPDPRMDCMIEMLRRDTDGVTESKTS
jgi:hypothetical protein